VDGGMVDSERVSSVDVIVHRPSYALRKKDWSISATDGKGSAQKEDFRGFKENPKLFRLY